VQGIHLGLLIMGGTGQSTAPAAAYLLENPPTNNGLWGAIAMGEPGGSGSAQLVQG
jgi:hypothetical protein